MDEVDRCDKWSVERRQQQSPTLYRGKPIAESVRHDGRESVGRLVGRVVDEAVQHTTVSMTGQTNMKRVKRP